MFIWESKISALKQIQRFTDVRNPLVSGYHYIISSVLYTAGFQIQSVVPKLISIIYVSVKHSFQKICQSSFESPGKQQANLNTLFHCSRNTLEYSYTRDPWYLTVKNYISNSKAVNPTGSCKSSLSFILNMNTLFCEAIGHFLAF